MGHPWDSLLVRVGPTPDDILRMGPVFGSGGVATDGSTVWLSAHDVAAVWRLPLPMP